MDTLKAHMAAVRSLTGYGVTAVSANEIISRMEDTQPDEWARTLQRCANGEANRVRLFVVWNDVRDFTTFLYSGDQDSTVAYLFRTLAEVQSGELVSEDADLSDATPAEVEGYNKVACFDIGKELIAAVR